MEYHIVFEKNEAIVNDYSEISSTIGNRPYNPSNLFLGIYVTGTERGAMNPNPADKQRLNKFFRKLEEIINPPSVQTKHPRLSQRS